MKISLVSIPVQDPLQAHEIYTKKLGFRSKEFKPEASLAIVVSPDDPDGTALLLEPYKGSFAETFQTAAYDANLPIMIFAAVNPTTEMESLASAGVKVRPDLARPEWGWEHLFEDGCGNLLMLQQPPA
jgi:catechol 2,3-dioxygenase-like lactoylglutathione lyase family enzyme